MSDPIKREFDPGNYAAPMGDKLPKSNSYSLPFRCMVPAAHIGFIIGPKGATLREIMQESGAFVQVAKDFNEAPDKILSIIGAGEQKVRAIRSVLTRLCHIERRNDDVPVFVLLAPTSSMGIVQTEASQIAVANNVAAIDTSIPPFESVGLFPIVIRNGNVDSVAQTAASIYKCLNKALKDGILKESDFEIFGFLSAHDHRHPLQDVPPSAPQFQQQPPQQQGGYPPQNYPPQQQQGGYPQQQQQQQYPPQFQQQQQQQGQQQGQQGGQFRQGTAIHPCPPVPIQLAPGQMHPLTPPDFRNNPLGASVQWAPGGAFPLDGFQPRMPTPDQVGLQTNFMLRIVVPQETGGWILGRSASNIRFLSGFTGVNVRYDRDVQRLPIFETERQVRVLGGVLGKRVAARLVLDQLMEMYPSLLSVPLRMVITVNQARQVVHAKQFIEQRANVTLTFGANNLPNADDVGQTEKMILIDGPDYETKLGGFLLLHWACEQFESQELKTQGAPAIPLPFAVLRPDCHNFVRMEGSPQEAPVAQLANQAAQAAPGFQAGHAEQQRVANPAEIAPSSSIPIGGGLQFAQLAAKAGITSEQLQDSTEHVLELSMKAFEIDALASGEHPVVDRIANQINCQVLVGKKVDDKGAKRVQLKGPATSIALASLLILQESSKVPRPTEQQ